MKDYIFESANGYTVTVSVDGSYRDSYAKDITCVYDRDTEQGHEGASKSWEELEDGYVVIQWLIDQGCVFGSVRALRFNVSYINYVMIDEDMTLDELLDKAAFWTDEDLANWYEWSDLNATFKEGE